MSHLMSAIDSSRLHQCTAVRLNSIAPRVLQCMNSEAEYVPRIGVQGLSRPATLVDSFWKVFQISGGFDARIPRDYATGMISVRLLTRAKRSRCRRKEVLWNSDLYTFCGALMMTPCRCFGHTGTCERCTGGRSDSSSYAIALGEGSKLKWWLPWCDTCQFPRYPGVLPVLLVSVASPAVMVPE
jgi:hypothetical protein